VAPAYFGRLLADSARIGLVTELRRAGFTYVTLDLEGYLAGSMNRAFAI